MPLWYVPSPQGVHSDAAALETEPAGHLSQDGGSLVGLRKVPAMQSVQNDEPRSEDPELHFAHSVWPASSWYLPSEHASQPVAPSVALLDREPGRHCVHCPALAVDDSPT